MTVMIIMINTMAVIVTVMIMIITVTDCDQYHDMYSDDHDHHSD